MTTLLSKKDFSNALYEELNLHLTLDHPIFNVLLETKNPALIKKMTLQGYQLTKNFLEYIENLYFHCPLPNHKRRLLFNMFEEETGKLSKTNNHVTLMQNFITALGISKDEREEEVSYPETQELIDYRMNLVKDKDKYHMGVAAVQIASEGQNLETKASEARHTLLIREFGMKEEDLLFFSVHQREDVGHVRQGVELVVDLCDTPEKQEEALHAVKHTCELFYNMYEGVYKRHCV